MGKFDTTDLTISSGLKSTGSASLHRDYIAHCFRWSFIARRCGNIKVNSSKRKILEFGCGKDIPLVDTLFCSRRFDAIASYVGVDLNKIKPPAWRQSITKKDNYKFLGGTNIMDVTSDDAGDVNTIVSLEVFEHCPPEVVEPILLQLHGLMSEDGEFIYSTPCYDPKPTVGAAKNHINEMTRDCFGWLLEETGHTVIENYGTFASQNDYKKHLTPAQREVFDELSKYHEGTVLANFLAPSIPQYSRNNVWVCKKRKEGDERLFPTPGQLPRSQNGYWDNV